MQMTKNFEKGMLFTFLSALCLSLFGLFTKLQLGSTALLPFLFLRFLLPLLLLLPFLAIAGSLTSVFPIRNVRSQLLRAFCVVISQYCIFYYLTQGTLFNASMLVSIGPILIPLFSKLFYQHKVSRITWVSLVISLVGVALILRPTSGIFDLLSIYGLIAGLGVAISQVLYGVNAERESNLQNLFYLLFFSLLLSMIPILIGIWIHKIDFVMQAKLPFVSLDKNTIFLFLLSFATIASQFFRGIAYQHANPVSLAPFLYANVLFSGVFDWLIYKNVPTLQSALGAALIIFASFLKWSSKRK